MLNHQSIEKQMLYAIKILKQGGIVAYPTDTVYGLGADPFNERAVERIYKAKKRSRQLALPLLIADTAYLSKVADSIPEIAYKLAEYFFPGQLTIVLKKHANIPDIVNAGGDTIAVRMPDHAIALEIIRGIGGLIIGTSANLSGKPSTKTAEEVDQQLGERIDFIVDGGACPGGIESTVIDLSGKSPAILREGAISREVITKVSGLVLHVKSRDNLDSKW